MAFAENNGLKLYLIKTVTKVKNKIVIDRLFGIKFNEF